MAKLEVLKDINGTLKPLKVTNVDLEYNINDQDSQGDFLGLMFGSLMTQSAAIVIPDKDKKATGFFSFYVYDPARFKINATENSMKTEFVYSSQSGSEVKFKPEDIIYIAPRTDPSNLLYATSRLKPMNDLLLLQANIMAQQKAYYGSGGKDSTIISPKEPLGKEKAEQLKTAFDAFLQTTATKTLFLNTDVDVTSISNAQSPSQIMDALTKINSMVIQQYGVPSYFFGDYQGYINNEAIVTAARLFFQVHMKPLFNSIAFQFTRYFRNTLGIKNCVIKFSYSDVEILEDNLSTKIDNASKLYKLGLLSMNEARIECEREPLPDDAADRHMVPAYLTGQVPVSIEQFDETIAKLFADSAPSEIPSGTTGGEDNANLVNDSVGGAGNVGE